jgi:hypothetical protein
VKVDGTILHGWSSPCASERVSATWSASYHLAEETSRFILSTGTRIVAARNELRWNSCEASAPDLIFAEHNEP